MKQEKPKIVAYQDNFLAHLQATAKPVSIYLHNGIKLQGYIAMFDAHVIILRAAAISQMVYKHAVLTIVPSLQPHCTKTP